MSAGKDGGRVMGRGDERVERSQTDGGAGRVVTDAVGGLWGGEQRQVCQSTSNWRKQGEEKTHQQWREETVQTPVLIHRCRFSALIRR